ncbi:tetratricopeptide repeat protein, partial [Desulfobacterales bacterium HSG17]|nr:tetratricopeptide repeat protein [Desulfobacterales bacterium HSG17]
DYESADYKSAKKNIKRALESEPENPDYNYFMGKINIKKKNLEDAVKYLEKAYSLAPDISGLKYDLAFALFKTEDYNKSAELFAEIVKKNPDHALANYHAGSAFYKLEKFSLVHEYMSRAAGKSPSLRPRANYLMGICYEKQGIWNKALEMFAKVEADPEADESIKSRAKKRKKNCNPFRLSARIGIRYDDNVQLDPLDKDLYEDQDDTLAIINFTGFYDLIRREKFTFGAGYLHYQTLHSDLKEYDLTGSTGSAYAKYRLKPFVFKISFMPSFYWLNSESYERRYTLKPETLWLMGKEYTSRLSYQYTDIHNFDDDDQAGDAHETNLEIMKSIMDKRILLRCGTGVKFYDAEAEDETYFSWNIGAGITAKLPGKFDASLKGKFREFRYDIEDNCGCKKQHDRTRSAAVSISRPVFYDWLRVTGEYRYKKRDS